MQRLHKNAAPALSLQKLELISMDDAIRAEAEWGKDARLSDEIEQLRTALENSVEEVTRLVEDRDRLLRRVAEQSRELQAANAAYAKAAASHAPPAPADLAAQLRADQDQEELRVAFEEMQVLTEELDSANNSLLESNRLLDRRVQERTRELEQKNLALSESERRFRALVEGIPQLVWRAGEPGEWTWASPQWAAFTGQSDDDSFGWGWLESVHPEDRQSAREAWAQVEARGGFEAEYRICNQDEQTYRWFQTRATPVRDAGDRIVEWLGTSTDIDDLRDLQERQQVLVAELQHRTRNLMGVIRFMSDETARGSADLADFRAKYRDRLDAMARVQGLLSRLNEHDRVTFDELINTELAAMHGTSDKVRLVGPPGVRLRSSTVQTLALALHELATNAVKYGALSQPDAGLTVTWSCEPSGAHNKPWLHIDWRETGVTMPPPGSAPLGSGQGRKLIERALPYQLKARTSYVLGPDGVHCTLSIPISNTLQETVDA